MATSSKTKKTDSGRKAAGSAGKATGSARKAAGSAGKATGSARKATAGSSRKANGSAASKATGSARQATAGSSRKANGSAASKATGSARQATAGSSRKANGSAASKATGSARQTTAGSSRKVTDSARKTSSAAGRKSGVGTGRKTSGSGSRAIGSRPEAGIYVYGIVPADVELADEMPGVGDPPGQIRVIRSDGLAALVSEVDLSRQLGSPEDLMAHKDILDASAAELPVLPLRFGAVLASEDAVAEDLLDANHDEFADAIDELDGRVQFVVKGRYVEDAILGEVLSENKQAARLAEKIRGQNSDATRDARIQLGELINDAVTAKREEDTRALGQAMEGHCAASVVREPTHELDAVHVAFLVDADEASEMEAAIEDLARDWDRRVEMRLLGPMAAYDFVGSREPVS
jgi:hypothetical protein